MNRLVVATFMAVALAPLPHSSDPESAPGYLAEDE